MKQRRRYRFTVAVAAPLLLFLCGPAHHALAGQPDPPDDTHRSIRFGYNVLFGTSLPVSGTPGGSQAQYDKTTGWMIAPLVFHAAWEPARIALVWTVVDHAMFDVSQPSLSMGYSLDGLAAWLSWEFYGLGIWEHLFIAPVVGFGVVDMTLSAQDSGDWIAKSGLTNEYTIGLSAGLFNREEGMFFNGTINYMYRFAEFDEFSFTSQNVPLPFSDPNTTVSVSGHLIWLDIGVAIYPW